MVTEFDGLTAIATGGASGIGAAIARVLLDRGTDVAVLNLTPELAIEGVLAAQADVADDAEGEGCSAHGCEAFWSGGHPH